MSINSPSIEILVQPASNKLRFRYESERPSSAMEGVGSTKENKKYPAIRVIGYTGNATITVSLVTHTEPYGPHPKYKIISKENGKRKMRLVDGKLLMNVDVVNGMEPIEFDSICVMCVKKDDIPNVNALKMKSCDMNAVRLAFDLCANNGEIRRTVSDIIYDSKCISKLNIIDISCPSSVVDGGAKIFVFCDKVQKKNVRVQFLENNNGVNKVWSEIEPVHIHHQVAMIFIAPKYHKLNIVRPVQTFLRLMRPKEGDTGPLVPFEYYPRDSRRNPAKRTEISAIAIDQSNISLRSEILAEVKRNKRETYNIKPEIDTTPQPVPGPSHEFRLNKPSAPQLQFQQPSHSFHSTTYPKEQHNYQMLNNMQATNAYPQVNRNFVQPLQNQNRFPNHNVTYSPAAINQSNLYHTNGNNFAATNYHLPYGPPEPQPQPTLSNWNVSHHATHNGYRDGKNLGGADYMPIGTMATYNENFSTVTRQNDQATVVNKGSVAQNMSMSDWFSENIKNLEDTCLDNFINFSGLSCDDNNENPTAP